ncbi:hypothetical protein, partial [Paracoccus haematequi]|uniref:hypothetical protein n=1 Tax=Paracoccus haematequi TaxID=2491866 RepID=UPI0013E08CAD
SVNVVRIKVASHLAALNQPAISLEILKRQHALVAQENHKLGRLAIRKLVTQQERAMEPLISQVVWSRRIDWKECVNVFGRDYCIEIRGEVRIVHDSGSYYLEIDAFGQRFRFNLTQGCFPLYEVGIARFKVCMQPLASGVRVVIQGCIGVAGIEKCWDIIGEDITWFSVKDLSDDEVLSLGIPKHEITRAKEQKGFGSVSSSLSSQEIQEILGS